MNIADLKKIYIKEEVLARKLRWWEKCLLTGLAIFCHIVFKTMTPLEKLAERCMRPFRKMFRPVKNFWIAIFPDTPEGHFLRLLFFGACTFGLAALSGLPFSFFY